MPPATLFSYVARRAVLVVAAMLLGFLAVSAFADLAESLRFIGKYDKGNFGLAFAVTLLRTPSIMHDLLPFVFLFGAIWLFAQMNRRSEIAVLRSSGLSIWRLIAPVALVAGLAGLLSVTLVDPLASRMLAFSERLKEQTQGKTGSIVRVFGDGVWLRQRDADNILLINAQSFDPGKAALAMVSIWRLDADSRFIERVDAPKAVLSGRTIELHEARIRSADEELDYRTPVYAIASSLTASDMRERLNMPETMSVWSLPRFILLAEAAGLSTSVYDLRFHDLCATPLKLVGMVLIAALFSLRPFRSGGAFVLFGAAIAAGFAVYLLSEVASGAGLSGLVPPVLAAWTPPVVVALFALVGLLYIEEG